MAGTSHAFEARSIQIRTGRVTLQGDLTIPPMAGGIVLFAHGSGSGRHSPRNRFVADRLGELGLATLLFDLLTADEEAEDARTSQLYFDIALLAERLVGASDWAGEDPETRGMRIGYFGASTGGGAALVAASERPDSVGAVVSRGGRPDLAGNALSRVKAPTLLIVGGNDEPVIAMNQRALGHLRSEKRLEIVPGATHLFEEPGTLAEVARLAGEWLKDHLAPT